MWWRDKDGEFWHASEVDPLEAESVYGMVRVSNEEVEQHTIQSARDWAARLEGIEP